MWFEGSSLDGLPGLGQLRVRWATGRAGAAPAPDQFDGAATAQVYAYAANDIRAARTARGQADIAWAAADLLTSAAQATGNPGLARAADGFRRAARAPWGRAPTSSSAGAMLRTAAYLMAGCVPVDRRSAVRRALIGALAGLARAVFEMRRERMRAEQARRVREESARRLCGPQGPERKNQVRSLQSEAAHRTAQNLATIAGPIWDTDPAVAAAAAANRTAPKARQARPDPATRRRAGP